MLVLSLSTDQTNTEAQMRASKFGSLSAKVSSQLSFVNSELVELPERSYYKKQFNYLHDYRTLFRINYLAKNNINFIQK